VLFPWGQSVGLVPHHRASHFASGRHRQDVVAQAQCRLGDGACNGLVAKQADLRAGRPVRRCPTAFDGTEISREISIDE